MVGSGENKNKKRKRRGQRIGEALEVCEWDLRIKFPTPTSTPTPIKTKTKMTPMMTDLDAHLHLIVLTLGVLYHMHHGHTCKAHNQQGHMHALFDGEFFAKGGKGWVEVSFLSLSSFLAPSISSFGSVFV